jgi:hypothetical protein
MSDAKGFEEFEEEDVELEADTASVEDSTPIPDCEGIDRDGWSGKALLARHTDGSDFAEVIIITADPNACVDGLTRLGKDDVGIIILEVYNGDPGVGDMCLRWPMRQVFYLGDNGYVSVYDHARKRHAIDKQLQGDRKRAGLRQYRYNRRTRAEAAFNKRAEMVSHESIAEAFAKVCCDEQCIQKFPPSTIRALRTEMHMQSFQVKTSKNLDVHKMMRTGATGGTQLVTIEGIDICPVAWRIVHNIPLRTFERYKAKAKAGVRGAPHGNFQQSKSRTATIQAIETLRSLLEQTADHMPHLSRTLRNGQKVGLKVLPAGTEWKQLLGIVNEVRLLCTWNTVYGINLSRTWLQCFIAQEIQWKFCDIHRITCSLAALRRRHVSLSVCRQT